MINVLHVVISLRVGGLERFVVELTKNFSKDVTPLIVCLEETGELASYVNNARVVALNCGIGLKFRSVYKLIDIVRKNKINIIHTHNEAAHFYGTMTGVLSRVPVIHTRHGRYLDNNPRKMFLNIISSFFATKCVGVSQDVTDLMSRMEKINTQKTLTILNGIDTNTFSPHSANGENNRSQNGRGKFIRIGIVARLDIVKDHSNLLMACYYLNKKNKNFKLFIVGDGPMRKSLENEVEKLQLEEKVVFTGTRHDIADILNSLDIYVLSSISEGMSLTLIEAMSCCLPVVATDVGGNPEVVVNGVTGFIIPPQKPKLFTEKISILINDSILRESMGVEGRKRVIEKFSIKETARKYEDLYYKVLGSCQ